MPDLFKGFAEMILKETLNEQKDGVTIGGSRIYAIKFGGDQVLLSKSPKHCKL